MREKKDIVIRDESETLTGEGLETLKLCEKCEDQILNRLYYICATYQSIQGRKSVYKEICKLIYDITRNENYNPDNENWDEEPNELIRITKIFEDLSKDKKKPIEEIIEECVKEMKGSEIDE